MSQTSWAFFRVNSLDLIASGSRCGHFDLFLGSPKCRLKLCWSSTTSRSCFFPGALAIALVQCLSCEASSFESSGAPQPARQPGQGPGATLHHGRDLFRTPSPFGLTHSWILAQDQVPLGRRRSEQRMVAEMSITRRDLKAGRPKPPGSVYYALSL